MAARFLPHVIEQIVPVDGDPTYVFTPTARGTLPVSPENLSIVQDAMVSVVMNPRGTAYRTSAYGLNSFVNSTGIPVAAKTGTAGSGYADPACLVCGFIPLPGREDRPDIAVAVLVENGGKARWRQPGSVALFWSFISWVAHRCVILGKFKSAWLLPLRLK